MALPNINVWFVDDYIDGYSIVLKNEGQPEEQINFSASAGHPITLLLPNLTHFNIIKIIIPIIQIGAVKVAIAQTSYLNAYTLGENP